MKQGCTFAVRGFDRCFVNDKQTVVRARIASMGTSCLALLVLIVFASPVHGGGIFSGLYFGESVFSIDPAAQGMGGAGLGVLRGSPDAMNPVSLARSNLTYFGITYRPQISWANDGKETQRLVSGQLSSAVFSLPVWKGIFVGTGVEQVNSAYYRSSAVDSSESAGVYTRRFSRTGGIYGGGLSVAYSPRKWVGVGIGWRWLFGGLSESWEVDFSSSGYVDTQDELVQRYGGGYPAFGLMLGHDDFGLGVYWRGKVDGEGSYLLRTVYDLEESQDFGFSLPNRWGVGASFGPYSGLRMAADLWHENWSSADFGGSSASFVDCTSFGFGVEYSPTEDGKRKFLPLRVGYRWKPGYYLVKLEDGSNSVTPPGDEAISFGTSWITRNGRGAVHLAASYGRRGGLLLSGVKERYLELSIGFSGFEKWTTRRFSGA